MSQHAAPEAEQHARQVAGQRVPLMKIGNRFLKTKFKILFAFFFV